MPPARSSVSQQHLGALWLQGLQEQLLPADPAGFFFWQTQASIHTGKADQGAICRSCTTKDSEYLTSSYQTLREVMLQVQKDSISIIIIIIIIHPTYISIELSQEKGAVPWHHPSSTELLFFPIPPSEEIRLCLCSPTDPSFRFCITPEPHLETWVIPELKQKCIRGKQNGWGVGGLKFVTLRWTPASHC